MPYDNQGNYREATPYEEALHALQLLTDKHGDEVMLVTMKWQTENIKVGQANEKAWRQLTR